MKVVDMHCDTIGELFKNTELRNKIDAIISNNMHIDLDKLETGKYFLQNFALFVNLKYTTKPYDFCIDMIEYWKHILNDNPNIKEVLSYRDICDFEINKKEAKLLGMLTVEEGECTEGKPEKLDELYKRGVRMMTLTWNYENSLGYPATPRNPITGEQLDAAYYDRGLKENGQIIVEEMMRKGMIVDVSHLSDKGFYDVLHISKRMNVPFVASHSNARSICGNRRNLTDDMIRELGNAGGVIGLNFSPCFLKEGRAVEEQFDYMLLHIKHRINKGGIECIGLGSDFDGIDGELIMRDASQIQNLYDFLKRSGLSEHVIEHIFCKNVLSLYKRIL